MARINVSVPDELAVASRAAGLSFSEVLQAGLARELDRRAKVAELDAYLDELEAERGPVTAQEAAEAEAWADRVLGRTADRRPA